MKSLLGQILAYSEQCGGFDPGVALRQSTALHGLLICVGEASYDEAISGQEVLERAEAFIKEKFAEHGISTEKVNEDD